MELEMFDWKTITIRGGGVGKKTEESESRSIDAIYREVFLVPFPTILQSKMSEFRPRRRNRTANADDFAGQKIGIPTFIVGTRNSSLSLLRLFLFMANCVYILYSEKFDRYYIGQTHDFNERLIRHNSEYVPSTKLYVPWQLKCLIEKKSRSEALVLERKLKNLNRERRKRAAFLPHFFLQ